MERNYPLFTVTDKGERALRKGHPWVYDAELRLAEGSSMPADGELCDVRSRKGAYLGTGLYNSRSKIRVRILSRNANDRYDEGFFALLFGAVGDSGAEQARADDEIVVHCCSFY